VEEPAKGNAQPLSKKEMIELASGLRKGEKKAEVISLRLDAYEQAVEVEEAEKAALESRLSLESAQVEWNAYAVTVESPTLRQAMTAALLALDDKTLSATVGMTTHRSLLQQELSRLLDTLRQCLHDPALKIQILLDESKAQELRPQAPKRPLTAKEKLDKMKEVNPLVEDLLKKFDLKLDE